MALHRRFGRSGWRDEMRRRREGAAGEPKEAAEERADSAPQEAPKAAPQAAPQPPAPASAGAPAKASSRIQPRPAPAPASAPAAPAGAGKPSASQRVAPPASPALRRASSHVMQPARRPEPPKAKEPPPEEEKPEAPEEPEEPEEPGEAEPGETGDSEEASDKAEPGQEADEGGKEPAKDRARSSRVLSRLSGRKSSRTSGRGKSDGDDEEEEGGGKSKRSFKRRRRLPKITLKMLAVPALILGVAALVVLAFSVKPHLRKKNLEALGAKDDSTRSGAVSALAAEGAPAVDDLAKILGGKNEIARDAAGEALGRIAAAGQSEPVVAAVRSLLDSKPDAAIRSSAAKALASGGSSAALAALEPLLSDQEFQVRKTVVEALSGRKSNETVKLMLRAMEDTHYEVQTAAAKAFGLCVDRTAAPVLAEALRTSKNTAVQRAAAKALAGMPDAVKSEDVAAQASHEDIDVRRSVITILSKKADPAATPALIAAVSDQDAQIREMSLSACASARCEDVVPKLVGILRNDANPSIRLIAARAIGSFKVPDGPGVLREKLADDKEELPVRIACARALGCYGPADLKAEERMGTYYQLIDTLRLASVSRDLAEAAASALPKITGIEAPMGAKQWVEWYKNEEKKSGLIKEYRDKVAEIKKSAEGGGVKEFKAASLLAEKTRDELKPVKDKYKDAGELETIYWELNDLAKDFNKKFKAAGGVD